jgi:hypothetical protein
MSDAKFAATLRILGAARRMLANFTRLFWLLGRGRWRGQRDRRRRRKRRRGQRRGKIGRREKPVPTIDIGGETSGKRRETV